MKEEAPPALLRPSDPSPVHPHMCGEYYDLVGVPVPVIGSPPRVWGILLERNRTSASNRFTPTRVGNTHGKGLQSHPPPVHPHACGEYLGGSNLWIRFVGSPPRVWGIVSRFPCAARWGNHCTVAAATCSWVMGKVSVRTSCSPGPIITSLAPVNLLTASICSTTKRHPPPRHSPPSSPRQTPPSHPPPARHRGRAPNCRHRAPRQR